MTSVIRLCPMAIRRGGGLLAACGHMGIAGKRGAAWEVTLIALGIVAEFDRPASRAIEPDSKSLLIQA